ncbi:uncharacterized protein LOC141911066 [Tubulanus polymorphus]|uniref:uncharacterized protein LOC141911066 n=1 Tax=Tubulanus polymorphus TaxID=672921 RepID=UPI003DA5A7AA
MSSVSTNTEESCSDVTLVKTEKQKNNVVLVAKKDNKMNNNQKVSSKITRTFNDPLKKVTVTKTASATNVSSKLHSPKKLGAFSTSKKDLASVGKRKRFVSKSSPTITQSPKRNPLKAKCRIDFSMKPEIKFSNQKTFPVSAKKINVKQSTMGYSQLRQAELELRQKYEELELKMRTTEENHKLMVSNLEDELRTYQGQVKDLQGEKNELLETLSIKDAEYIKSSTALGKKLEMCENRLIELQIDPVSLKSLNVEQQEKENVNEIRLKQKEQAKVLLDKLELFTQKTSSYLSSVVAVNKETIADETSEMNCTDIDVNQTTTDDNHRHGQVLSVADTIQQENV